MKLDKRDRQGVRTPGDLEQKYPFEKMLGDNPSNVAALERKVEQLNTLLSQFIGTANSALAVLISAMDNLEWETEHNFKKYHPNTSMFYYVTNELENCVSDNVSEAMTEGDAYEAVITCADGYRITHYEAMMGDHALEDALTLLTETRLRVSIDAVTDDLSISVIAESL